LRLLMVPAHEDELVLSPASSLVDSASDERLLEPRTRVMGTRFNPLHFLGALTPQEIAILTARFFADPTSLPFPSPAIGLCPRKFYRRFN